MNIPKIMYQTKFQKIIFRKSKIIQLEIPYILIEKHYNIVL